MRFRLKVQASDFKRLRVDSSGFQVRGSRCRVEGELAHGFGSSVSRGISLIRPPPPPGTIMGPQAYCRVLWGGDFL